MNSEPKQAKEQSCILTDSATDKSFRNMNPIIPNSPQEAEGVQPTPSEPIIQSSAPPIIEPAWQKCVDAFSSQHIEILAKWRGYTPEFCIKLKEKLLVGLFNGRIAFPITNPQGQVIGCHHRPWPKDRGWRVTPFTGTNLPMFPFAVNAPENKERIAAFESQWDMLAYMEKDNWHAETIEDTGYIATRGAAFSGKYLKDYCQQGAAIMAFSQNDKAGKEWLARVQKAATGPVIDVSIPSGVKDFNDWTRAGATLEDIEAAISSATLLNPVIQTEQSDQNGLEADLADAKEAAYEGIKRLVTTKDGRVWVLLAKEDRLHSELAADMGRVLAETELYNRGGLPFVVDHGKHTLKLLTPECFRTWAENHAVCFNWDRPKEGPPSRKRKTMSVTDAATVLASGQFLKQLRQISKLNQVQLPVLRNSDRIELLPVGYDLESQTYTFDTTLDYPKTMTMAEAKKTIDDLFAEFCFPVDNGQSLSVVVSSMMTLFGRCLLPQSAIVPCFVFVANAEGAGKTLLVKAVVVPPYGQFIAGTKPTNEDELRKFLTTAVMEGRPYVCFDNLKEHLDSPSLEAFLTTSSWTDRILGSSKSFSGEKNTVVFATGNACTVSPDMRRRSLFVRLFMKEERAESRQFSRALDIPFLLEKRGSILSALWTMVQDWDAKGRPRGTKTHSSFPEWTQTIASIVENAGFASPVEMPDIDCAADRDGADMRKLIQSLPAKDVHPFTFKELLEHARKVGAFESLLGSETDVALERKINTAFSRILKRYDRRSVGDYIFQIIGQGHDRHYVFKKDGVNTAVAMPKELQD